MARRGQRRPAAPPSNSWAVGVKLNRSHGKEEREDACAARAKQFECRSRSLSRPPRPASVSILAPMLWESWEWSGILRSALRPERSRVHESRAPNVNECATLRFCGRDTVPRAFMNWFGGLFRYAAVYVRVCGVLHVSNLWTIIGRWLLFRIRILGTFNNFIFFFY